MAEKVLSKEQLRSYNMKMLNRGEPNVWDFSGYNKFHFASMMKLADLDKELTDGQAIWLARTLKKYVRTQLQEIKDVIDNTIEFYKANSSPKFRSDNKIEVAGFNRDRIAILWQFGGGINLRLKTMNLKEKYQLEWQETKGAWILRVDWKSIKELVKIFQDLGLDCSAIISTKRPSK